MAQRSMPEHEVLSAPGHWSGAARRERRRRRTRPHTLLAGIIHVGMRIFVLRTIGARNMLGIGARVDFSQCSAERPSTARVCTPSINVTTDAATSRGISFRGYASGS